MSLTDISSVHPLKECHSQGENSRDFCLQIFLLSAIRQHGNFCFINVAFFFTNILEKT